MNGAAKRISDAVNEEVAEFWEGVEIEWQQGGVHPKAKIRFAGLTKTQPIAGTPSSVDEAIKQSLGQFRRAFRQMGATRKVEESAEEDEKRIRVRNQAAVDARPNPVVGEKASTKPTVAEQFVAVAGQAGLELTPARARTVEEAREEEEEEPPIRVGPGVYDEITGEQYHLDPAATPSLSSSIAKILLDYSPMHAAFNHPRLNPNHEPLDKMAFRKGRAFHTMMLGKGNPIEVLDERIKDWRTKEAKEFRDAIVKDGGTPLLFEEHAALVSMCQAARYQFRQRPDLAYALAGGIPERIFIWEEQTRSGPILCRMMVDWEPAAGDLAPDLKSTKAEAFTAWGQRTMWDMGADIQDAFYRRGFAAFNRQIAALVFAVCEVDAPFGVMHHRVDPFSQAEADEAVEFAIQMWGYCVHRNKWPGYPREMAWQTKPGWRSQNFEARRASGLLDAAAIAEQLEQQERHAASAREIRGTNDDCVDRTDENPFGLPPIGEDE